MVLSPFVASPGRAALFFAGGYAALLAALCSQFVRSALLHCRSAIV
jgi:hypothetical protein